MMISTWGRYVLRIVTDFTECIDSSYIPSKDITGQQQISKKYLESIIKILVCGSLLDAFRVRGGDYRLNRSPAKYTVSNVLHLVENSLAPVAHLEEEATCERAAYCRILPMWQKLDRLINDFLDGCMLVGFAAPNLAGDGFVI